MLRAFGHPVATCCVFLAQVWNWSNLIKQHLTSRNISQHGGQRTPHVAPNNVATCCVCMLRSFGQGFSRSHIDGRWWRGCPHSVTGPGSLIMGNVIFLRNRNYGHKQCWLPPHFISEMMARSKTAEFLIRTRRMSVVSPTSSFAYKSIRLHRDRFAYRRKSFRLHDLSRFAYIQVVSPTLLSKIFCQDRWTLLPTGSRVAVFDRIAS